MVAFTLACHSEGEQKRCTCQYCCQEGVGLEGGDNRDRPYIVYSVFNVSVLLVWFVVIRLISSYFKEFLLLLISCGGMACTVHVPDAMFAVSLGNLQALGQMSTVGLCLLR